MAIGNEGKKDKIRIGCVSVSDRASSGIYEDKGLPALRQWLDRALITPWDCLSRLIADDQALIEATLKSLADDNNCSLILTTGGTGPAERDVTPEATLAVSDRVLPGFGEQMRRISLNFVATAILSRQLAAVRGKSLIVNLPGQPRAIAETLEGLRNKDGNIEVAGIFAAIPYCLDIIGAPRIETNADVVAAFRPKSG